MSPSTIEWTDEVWNPTVGCSKVSPGCDNCYAIRVAARLLQEAHWGVVKPATHNKKADWNGKVNLLPDRLDKPLHWRKPRRVFVDSMSDLFHPEVPDSFIHDVFAVMGAASEHTFQVLTKRTQRMVKMLTSEHFAAAVEHHMGAYTHATTEPPLPNVWLGTSVENQQYADLRIPQLLATPAAVRFLSIEPLLGPVRLKDEWIDLELQAFGSGGVKCFPRVDWVIVGGESGPGARPMHPAWVRSLRDQCTDAGVPFFFKQWGEWAPTSEGTGIYSSDIACADGSWRHRLGVRADEAAGEIGMRRVGKKAAGRELDGRTWDEMPEVAP